MEIQRKAKEEAQSYQRIQGEKQGQSQLDYGESVDGERSQEIEMIQAKENEKIRSGREKEKRQSNGDKEKLVRNGAYKNSMDKRKKKIESEEVNQDYDEINETQYGEQNLFQDTEKPIQEIAQDQIFNQQKSKIGIKEKQGDKKRELFQQRQNPGLQEEDQSQLQDYHDEQDSQSEEQEKSYQEEKVSNKILNIQINNKGSQEYVLEQIQKERNSPTVNSNRLTTVQQKIIQQAQPQQSKKYTRQSSSRNPKKQQICSPISSKSKKKSDSEGYNSYNIIFQRSPMQRLKKKKLLSQHNLEQQLFKDRETDLIDLLIQDERLRSDEA